MSNLPQPKSFYGTDSDQYLNLLMGMSRGNVELLTESFSGQTGAQLAKAHHVALVWQMEEGERMSLAAREAVRYHAEAILRWVDFQTDQEPQAWKYRLANQASADAWAAEARVATDEAWGF